MKTELCLIICFITGVLIFYLLKQSCGCGSIEGNGGGTPTEGGDDGQWTPNDNIILDSSYINNPGGVGPNPDSLGGLVMDITSDAYTLLSDFTKACEKKPENNGHVKLVNIGQASGSPKKIIRCMSGTISVAPDTRDSHNNIIPQDCTISDGTNWTVSCQNGNPTTFKNGTADWACTCNNAGGQVNSGEYYLSIVNKRKMLTLDDDGKVTRDESGNVEIERDYRVIKVQ